MAKLIRRASTLAKINAKQYGGQPRPYLGMSGCGEPCLRKRYYGFHWVAAGLHQARTQRIFSIGHLFEKILIEDLKAVGCEVYKVIDGKEYPMTGDVEEQQEEYIDHTGHMKGHPDGRVRGLLEAPKTEHKLEIKTMAAKYWEDVKKRGVQLAHPMYYAQMQRYMGEAKLERALFCAVNKNTCHYYFERIEFDKKVYDDLVRADLSVIFTDAPPPKHYPEGHYKCRADGDMEIGFCKYGNVCHLDQDPMINCRTCDYSDMEDGGKWSCQKQKDKVLTVQEQRDGCKKYKKGWGL